AMSASSTTSALPSRAPPMASFSSASCSARLGSRARAEELILEPIVAPPPRRSVAEKRRRSGASGRGGRKGGLAGYSAHRRRLGPADFRGGGGAQGGLTRAPCRGDDCPRGGKRGRQKHAARSAGHGAPPAPRARDLRAARGGGRARATRARLGVARVAL